MLQEDNPSHVNVTSRTPKNQWEEIIQRMAKADTLLSNIKDSLSSLSEIKRSVNEPCNGAAEEGIYRFYHFSFKCYYLQQLTEVIVAKLRQLSPNDPTEKLCVFFEDIISQGTGKKWEYQHNADWQTHTRPIVEAFMHANHMLCLAVEYGSRYEKSPEVIDYGWGSLLELYNIR